MISDVLSLIAEITSLGIELKAHRGAVRYRPIDAMPAHLLARIRQHKQAVLELLEQLDNDPNGVAANTLATVPDRERRIDLRYAYDERAGIVEYSGNAKRRDAERQACLELITMIAADGSAAIPGE